ncbi:MAG: hypothetical protein EPO26_10580 [Chloroflexota bacterium]|nr:MAG: hypothetical protein EPO26_10580 [Chloroflexota bacterium]
MCHACGGSPVAECELCLQPYCERHRGEAPRPEWCAECVANAKVEESLSWSVSGCALGSIGGIFILIVLWIVAPAVATGPGRAFAIVAVSALATATALYAVRRARLAKRRRS